MLGSHNSNIKINKPKLIRTIHNNYIRIITKKREVGMQLDTVFWNVEIERFLNFQFLPNYQPR